MTANSISAVIAISDSLGIQLNNQNIIELVAQDGEYYVQQLIESVYILLNKTNSEKLTVDHVNTILKNNSLKSLYGYSYDTEFKIKDIQYNENIIYSITEKRINTKDIFMNEKKNIEVNKPFNFEWLQAFGTDLNSYSNIFRKELDSSNKNKSAKDTDLSCLKQYYECFMQIFESKSQDLIESFLYSLEVDSNIHLVVPYLLRLCIKVISTSLNCFEELTIVGNSILALLNNNSYPCSFYLHSVIKIGFTLALKKVILTNTDEEIKIRNIGSEIILKCVVLGSDQFPSLKREILNKLTDYIFDTESTSYIIYGALITFLEIDEIDEKMIPHCCYILKNLSNEINDDDDHTLILINKIKTHLNILLKNNKVVNQEYIEMLHEICDFGTEKK